MTTFTPGLELCRAFHAEAVAPLLTAGFPALSYSAALLGSGSEVLGYDSERSTDHHWGPRLQLFLAPRNHAGHAQAVRDLLARELPLSFRGYSTNWGPPDEGGVQLLLPVEHGPVSHRIEVVTAGAFLRSTLGFDPRGGGSVTDWLVTPSQLLLSVTAGAVYHDGLGELEPMRAALAWYPHDVGLYLLACQWQRIAQEEAFVGRCGEAGDDLGSRIVAARLVRDLIRLCFLLERRYAPYSKWLGTAFSRLACGPTLIPVLGSVLAATEWRDREKQLARAYELIAATHNALGVTDPVDPAARRYYGRPFLVLRADRFADAARRAITDQAVRSLSNDAGAVDQFIDNTDVLSAPAYAQRLRVMFD